MSEGCYKQCSEFGYEFPYHSVFTGKTVKSILKFILVQTTFWEVWLLLSSFFQVKIGLLFFNTVWDQNGWIVVNFKLDFERCDYLLSSSFRWRLVFSSSTLFETKMGDLLPFEESAGGSNLVYAQWGKFLHLESILCLLRVMKILKWKLEHISTYSIVVSKMEFYKYY